MGVLADWQIAQRARAGMITPFVPEKIRPVDGGLSYGLESYGYTLQCATEWRITDPTLSAAQLASIVFDPLHPETLDQTLVPYTGDTVILEPGSFALGRSAERWNIPADLLCVIIGKSTWARMGLIINTTPLEPGWGSTNPEGGDYITLEFSNTSRCRILLRAGACGQVLFHRGDQPCRNTYGDTGRYQGQDGIVLPRTS
jgi:dCTP deaminase